MKEMFCFQCQQTAHNTGCEGKAGVCGKKSDTANFQDELIGALIGRARAAKSGRPTAQTDELILKGLFTTITNVNFNNETIKKMKTEIETEKGRINSEKSDDYDMKKIWGKMVFAGATTFWETEKGAADFDNAGSLCHGWSALPIYITQRYLHNISAEQIRKLHDGSAF